MMQPLPKVSATGENVEFALYCQASGVMFFLQNALTIYNTYFLQPALFALLLIDSSAEHLMLIIW